MQKTWFMVLFSFFFVGFAGVFAKPLDVSVSHHEIGHDVLEYEDAPAKMTLEQIRQLPKDVFISPNKEVPGHLFTDSAYWYRFDVENKSQTPIHRLLVFEPAWLDSVEVMVVSAEGNITKHEGGNMRPYAMRYLNHFWINFMHTFDVGHSQVYVRVKTRDPFIVSISLMEASAFYQKNLYISLCIGLIYGGIIAMLFYNLFLFFGIKQQYYLLYVFYLAAFLVMNATYNGYTFMYLFATYPEVQNWAQSTTIYLFTLTGLLFARSFLHLDKYHPRLYMATSYLIYTIFGVAVMVALFGSYRYHVIFAIGFAIIYGVYILSIALYSWIQGNSSARFFLLGAISGLVGTVITVLAVLSLIPFTRFTYKANDFGMFFDAVLLSIALADRMKITQEKKLIAEKEAKTDILTGLFNRRAYYQISEMEYQKILRHHRILCVVMFDVDEFKAINDTYGHHAGDRVLQCVATLTKETIREYDYAFRMGGDEFLLLLPETSEHQAAALAERLRQSIEKQPIDDGKGNTFYVTASFGIVEYTQRETSIESVTKRADEALYQAKKAGRNRVSILDKFSII